MQLIKHLFKNYMLELHIILGRNGRLGPAAVLGVGETTYRNNSECNGINAVAESGTKSCGSSEVKHRPDWSGGHHHHASCAQRGWHRAFQVESGQGSVWSYLPM